jgi:hypothetical protein
MANGPNPVGQRKGFFRLLWRAARQVFHETTGTVFLLLALSWIAATVRLWRHGSATWALIACSCFALMLVLFGLTSFRSARRLR